MPSSGVTQWGKVHSFSLKSLLSQKHHKILFHAKLYGVEKISLPEIFQSSRSVGLTQPAGHSYVPSSGAESLQCCSLQCPGQETSRRGSQRSCSLEAGTDPTTTISPLQSLCCPRRQQCMARTNLTQSWGLCGTFLSSALGHLDNPAQNPDLQLSHSATSSHFSFCANSTRTTTTSPCCSSNFLGAKDCL